MRQRIPSWVIAPVAIGLSLGTIWVVGKAQMRSDANNASVASSESSDTPAAPDNSGANGSSSDVPLPANTPPTFPDFSGKAADGSTFDFSSVKGKVVLVNFWATWCGPCRMEIPDLIALQKKYGPKGFTVVGLSEDDEFATAAAFAKQNGMTYPVLKTPDAVREQVHFDGLPTSFLIGKDGKIIRQVSGVYEGLSMQQFWSSDIEKAL